MAIQGYGNPNLDWLGQKSKTAIQPKDNNYKIREFGLNVTNRGQVQGGLSPEVANRINRTNFEITPGVNPYGKFASAEKIKPGETDVLDIGKPISNAGAQWLQKAYEEALAGTTHEITW